jgi:hypothetical protein
MFLHRWEDYIIAGTTVENKGKLILILSIKYLQLYMWLTTMLPGNCSIRFLKILAYIKNQQLISKRYEN